MSPVPCGPSYAWTSLDSCQHEDLEGGLRKEEKEQEAAARGSHAAR